MSEPVTVVPLPDKATTVNIGQLSACRNRSICATTGNEISLWPCSNWLLLEQQLLEEGEYWANSYVL